MRASRSLLPALALASVLLSSASHAQSSPNPQAVGGLQVMPTRVVLDDRTRTAAVLLVNSGAKRATYRVSFVEMAMSEAGTLDRVADAGTSSAEPLVRYSPRQVVLPPGASQTVRLQLRKPADLPPGEYRSHLAFTLIPDIAPAEAPVVDGGARTDVGVNLTAVYGVTIPVIVRSGETSMKVSVSDLRLERGADQKPQAVSFALDRSGTRSAYGDLTVTWSNGGKSVVISLQKGVGIYAQNGRRRFRIPLPPGFEAKGALHVRYADPDGPLLTEAELKLP